jgi:hypothetical protein
MRTKEFLSDVMRLAWQFVKRILGDLRSTGKASVKMADNPEGIELLNMELPVKMITPASTDKTKFISL